MRSKAATRIYQADLPEETIRVLLTQQCSTLVCLLSNLTDVRDRPILMRMAFMVCA
jgi:hypothetical protein